ncbi:MAG: MerR family transcriptional regulator [Acidimicrobiaceae bacterium]|nr:MerR family transcriptional regulator [Acidimicrobiaceae bacterium]MYD06317.1 MerR family transcriptional regulator [Acidimicrobiaceae bacterium]
MSMSWPMAKCCRSADSNWFLYMAQGRTEGGGMAAQPHHSIGEVLSLLQAEHSDVTISKIRFLESQGLIAPERTPSGYRKFYARDIAQLRWILAQQRDHFLPLKVIKKRLEEPGFTLEVEPLAAEESAAAEPTLFSKSVKKGGKARAAPDPVEAESEVEAEEAEDEFLEPVDGLSATELAEAAKIEVGTVRELDRLGLIVSIGRPGSAVYDPEAVTVAEAAAVFGEHGFEPRHMRMFKISAERQAGVLEQIFSSRLAKGGRSAQRARKELNELVRLGEELQRSILRRSFGDSLD